MPAPARALAQHFRHRVQIDHRPVLLQPLAIRGPDDDTAAGREHDVGERRQLGEHRFFAVAKARFALDLENRRDRHAELALELGIGVDERLVEPPRELAAERRFARARQSDQKEIAPMQMHPRIVVDSLRTRSRRDERERADSRRAHARYEPRSSECCATAT